MTSNIKQITNNSEDGYCKMPDGTLIQWGSIGGYEEAKRKDYTITFPIAFDTSYTYAMTANGRFFSDPNSYETVCTCKMVSATQAIVHVYNASTNYINAVFWVAVGRWK